MTQEHFATDFEVVQVSDDRVSLTIRCDEFEIVRADGLDISDDDYDLLKQIVSVLNSHSKLILPSDNIDDLEIPD